MIKVSCAVIIREQKILVTQRNVDSGNPLKWEFPGGKQEKGETIEECLKREITEELDINLKIWEKLIPITHSYEFGKIQLVPFICSISSGNIKLKEHQDFQWVKLNQLAEVDFTPADKKLIELPQNQSSLKKYLRKNMDNAG
jgi:8-oxo-dGTP diphosphatase